MPDSSRVRAQGWKAPAWSRDCVEPHWLPCALCGAVLGYFQLWLLETFGAFATFSRGGSLTAPGRAEAAPHFLEKP